MLRVATCFAFDHDPALVALAVAICVLACLTYISMLGRATAARGNMQLAWVAGAAVAFGGGVWATHFIALIGFRAAYQPTFALAPTIVSLAIAIAGSALAAEVQVRLAPRVGAPAVCRVLAGMLLGGSIAAMHFTGMLALRRAGMLLYDRDLMFASVVLGVALSLAAMLATPRRRAAAAGLLVSAILGLHFTAIAAVRMVPWVAGDSAGGVVPSGSLAMAIGAVALVILLLSLAGTLVDAHLSRRAVEEARRLHQFAEATFEGILFCRGGLITDTNGALRRLGGWDGKTLIGWRLERLFVPEAAGLVGPVGDGARTDAVETMLLTQDGTARPVELLCRTITQNGEPATVVAVRDVSERKAAQQRIGELAHYDLLTGCANRVLFRDRLAQALAMAERSGHSVALLYCNIDRFKEVNELHGHATGDRLLVELTNRLRTRLRDTDTLARLGGDEFAIIQPRIETLDDAGLLAGRLLGALAEPFEIDAQPIEIGMTVGIAVHPQDGATGETLLRAADIALRRGKQEARGAFHCYAPGMDSELVHRLTLEHDLTKAIQHGELRLHYQPVFQVHDRRLVGHEALARWQHPTRGMISPSVFVPMGERNRQIVPIGQWVLRTACVTAAAMPGESRIAVNLSPVQVRMDDLPRLVAEVLRDTGLAPERLELEITEGVLIEESAHTLAVLRALKRQGVRIVLDDFGTGYSSLSYLRRFPFDKLKIDQSFMNGLGEDGESDAIVRAILALAHSLRLEVTAEGVETETQLRMLRHYGCDQVQGFLLGRPGPGLGMVEVSARREAAAA
ncbi:MAG TPA: EAL domain-containing protein [Acetobacteraceae bacterium]|jgi:diguanylate cyclase (GGDEF)-like protein/PAS domain S-box-containing protein|nr:EAL domain-containing protein [Acetobacteraceae bacterium]